MKVRCKTCGEPTNQPITRIDRKIKGKRPQMPICKRCYDEYRTEWDAADIDQITKSTRKTIRGREEGEIALQDKERDISPIYVRKDKRYGVWRGYYAIGGGKKRIIPRSRYDTPEEAVQATLDYARGNGPINEDQVQRYCKERGFPYYPPQKNEVA